MIYKLKCKICGFEGMNLVTHIKFKHSITTAEYKAKYNETTVYLHSDELKQKISNSLKQLNKNKLFRQENSIRQKNGASCLTTKYWTNKGFTESDAKLKISELQKNNCKKHLENNDLQECSQFNTKFWIKRGFSEESAKLKITKIQQTMSKKSSKFSGHTRGDDEKERISSSMKKIIDKIGKGIWARHFGEFNGRSKSEIEFYNYIKTNIDPLIEANVPVGNYIVDILKSKKIIEFYGDFWHANPGIFESYNILKSHLGCSRLVSDVWNKDRERVNRLENNGYEVLIIWESDWKQHKDDCIEKIRKFLL